MRYVYIGNVPGHPYENTFCPGCGSIVIGRVGYDITLWKLDEQNRCAKCAYSLPIYGRLSSSVKQRRFIPVIS